MVGPVLHQELLLGSRRNRLYAFRWFYAAWLIAQVFYFWFQFQGEDYARRAALYAQNLTVSANEASAPEVVGARFAETFVAQQMLFLVLVIPAFVAGAVTDEKRRGTLQYLLTSDLEARHILLGKLLGRVAQVALLGLAGLPLFALLAGFGGVGPLTLLYAFLVLLLPTSSILPIKDPIADRRMYLPMIGLILIAVDFLGRLKVNRTTLTTVCGAIVLAATGATFARATVWSDPVSIWEDTVRKSPGKSRPHFQLAQAYSEQGRADLAVAEFEKAAAVEPPDFTLLLDWGLAYDGLHQPAKAIAKLREAVAAGTTPRDKAHATTQMGKVYADQQQWKEAAAAFNAAQALDPTFAPTFAYQGLMHLITNDPAGAIAQCQHALELDKNFQPARDCMATAAKMMGGRR